MVTSLHNVVHDSEDEFKPNGGNTRLCNVAVNDREAQFVDKGREISSKDNIIIELEDNERRVKKISWKFGNDITYSATFRKKTFPYTDPNVSFDTVRPDFEYKIGQKIGMAVYRNYKFGFSSKGMYEYYGWDKDLKQEPIMQLFGPDHAVSVLTGTITSLSKDGKVRHDINSYKGCSGAVIFLLDKDQEGLINENEVGKAIAVHGGGPEENVAFTVRHILEAVTATSGSPLPQHKGLVTKIQADKRPADKL